MTKPRKRRTRIDARAQDTFPKTFCIEFVLDQTSSMARCASQTVAGYNEYLNEQRDNPGPCQITLTKFSTKEITTPYEDLDINFAPPMTTGMFVPGGITNLYDTIVQRIDALRRRLEEWTYRPDVLFVVMTDGGENASAIKDINVVRTSVGVGRALGWSFAFLGADQDAVSVGTAMGFLPHECRTFDTAMMTETMRDLSAATTVYRTALASGNTARISLR